MTKTYIYHQMLGAAASRKRQIAMLIDPDKFDEDWFRATAVHPNFEAIHYIFVGGSLLQNSPERCIAKIKKHCNRPVILFPGHASHIQGDADALLLLSLISGRNPEFLIGNHVIAAASIKASGIETISTGYILTGNKGSSSVEYMSNTSPIPSNKTDIAVATALAGEMIGMKLIYLEAGSGAGETVPDSMIAAVRKSCNCVLLVGGGITTPEAIHQKFEAGADIVVIGTAFENNQLSLDDIKPC